MDRVKKAVEIVQDVSGYPKWMALLEVELMLLSAWAARERLLAAGYTQLIVEIGGLPQ